MYSERRRRVRDWVTGKRKGKGCCKFQCFTMQQKYQTAWGPRGQLQVEQQLYYCFSSMENSLFIRSSARAKPDPSLPRQ